MSALPKGIAATSGGGDWLEFVLRVPADDPDFCIHFALSARNDKLWFARIATLLLMHRDSWCDRSMRTHALPAAAHTRVPCHSPLAGSSRMGYTLGQIIFGEDAGTSSGACMTLTAACRASRPCPQARLGNHSAHPKRLSSLTSFATAADQLLVLSALAGRSHDALLLTRRSRSHPCEDGIARHCRVHVPPGAGEIQTAFEIVFETFAIHDVWGTCGVLMRAAQVSSICRYVAAPILSSGGVATLACSVVASRP